MSIVRLLWLMGCVAMLQSCASIPSSKPVDKVASQKLNQQHLLNIATIEQFTLQGRIGVQAEGKGFSGGLHWQHDSANDNIELYSPLGGQVASIKKTADKVALVDTKGNRISAADAETLTQTALGWQLPLTGLADWSLGRPTNSAIDAITWDEFGHLSTLKQDGWNIEYQNYSEQNGHFLPGKILLRSEKINLKLLVEKWDGFN
jgi:outer membrane lipoprotein LolB